MQSRDELNEIKQLAEVDLTNPNDLVAKMRTAEEKGAVSHTIGKLPKKGENLEIHGLSFKVDFADFVRGKFAVKLVLREPKPAKGK